MGKHFIDVTNIRVYLRSILLGFGIWFQDLVMNAVSRRESFSLAPDLLLHTTQTPFSLSLSHLGKHFKFVQVMTREACISNFGRPETRDILDQTNKLSNMYRATNCVNNAREASIFERKYYRFWLLHVERK